MATWKNSSKKSELIAWLHIGRDISPKLQSSTRLAPGDTALACPPPIIQGHWQVRHVWTFESSPDHFHRDSINGAGVVAGVGVNSSVLKVWPKVSHCIGMGLCKKWVDVQKMVAWLQRCTSKPGIDREGWLLGPARNTDQSLACLSVLSQWNPVSFWERCELVGPWSQGSRNYTLTWIFVTLTIGQAFPGRCTPWSHSFYRSSEPSAQELLTPPSTTLSTVVRSFSGPLSILPSRSLPNHVPFHPHPTPPHPPDQNFDPSPIDLSIIRTIFVSKTWYRSWKEPFLGCLKTVQCGFLLTLNLESWQGSLHEGMNIPPSSISSHPMTVFSGHHHPQPALVRFGKSLPS